MVHLVVNIILLLSVAVEIITVGVCMFSILVLSRNRCVELPIILFISVSFLRIGDLME